MERFCFGALCIFAKGQHTATLIGHVNVASMDRLPEPDALEPIPTISMPMAQGG